jgi:hypothetical protein
MPIDGVALLMKKRHCQEILTWDISTRYTGKMSGYVPGKIFVTVTFLHNKRYTIAIRVKYLKYLYLNKSFDFTINTFKKNAKISLIFVKSKEMLLVIILMLLFSFLMQIKSFIFVLLPLDQHNNKKYIIV